MPLAESAELPSVNAQVDSATQLRVDRLAALRERQGNVATIGYRFPVQDNDAEQDPQTEFAYSRSTDRLANGVGFSPLVVDYGADEEMAEELGEEASEEEYEQAMFAIQQQAQAEEGMEQAARNRSMVQRMKEDHQNNLLEKQAKQAQEMLEKRQADLASKGLSLVDQGELAEVGDASGVSLSLVQVAATIFKDSIPKEMQKGFLRPWKMSDFTDVVMAALTTPQVLWMVLKFLLILAVLIFIIMSLGNLCQQSLPCRLGITRLF